MAGGQPYESLIQTVADRPGHDRRYAMDITKISQELGWRPKQSLESGLLKTAAWYVDHPEWAAAIQEKAEYAGWLKRNYADRGGQK